MLYASIASMNKTVYLRDEEVAIWEKARELSRDKLSPVIVAALKRFIVDREAAPKGFERIELRFSDSKNHGIPTAKAFYGRWIFRKETPIAFEREDGDEINRFCVAVTAKGAVVRANGYRCRRRPFIEVTRGLRWDTCETSDQRRRNACSRRRTARPGGGRMDRRAGGECSAS